LKFAQNLYRKLLKLCSVNKITENAIWPEAICSPRPALRSHRPVRRLAGAAHLASPAHDGLRPVCASADRPWPSDADPTAERDDRAEQNAPLEQNPSSLSPFSVTLWRLREEAEPRGDARRLVSVSPRRERVSSVGSAPAGAPPATAMLAAAAPFPSPLSFFFLPTTASPLA
jgi:hypothetical protein